VPDGLRRIVWPSFRAGLFIATDATDDDQQPDGHQFVSPSIHYGSSDIHRNGDVCRECARPHAVGISDGDIEVAGSIEPTGGYGACTTQSTGTCYVVSAMKYAVSLTTPSGFAYSYTAGAGTANTVVAAGAAGNSIIGVQYFTTNYFLLDFKSSLVGWK
jgi:hypothetical protein